MRKMFLSLMAILSIGTLSAISHPAPGGFGVTAEYLYFMPTFDDTYFVISSDTVNGNGPLGERLNNDFDFKSGYRIGAAYAFCTCERQVEVIYTHLNASQNRTVGGLRLWPTLGSPTMLSSLAAAAPYAGTATSNLSAKYNRVDALFSQGVFDCNSCQLDVRLLCGVEYAYLQLDENYSFDPTGDPFDVVRTSHTWGVGPEIGFEMDYSLWRCDRCLPGVLSLVVRSTGSLLSGNTKTTASDIRTLAGVTTIFDDVNDEAGWRVIPVLHARVGLEYDMCFCGQETSLEIGYEFSSYLRGFARTTVPDDVATSDLLTNYNSYDLQGLYVSASVSF